jgi:N-acetylmuramoyl-L-alanine amidase
MPVSAHYGVSRHGAIHQYVDEMDTAWHAGRVHDPVWPLLKTRVNPNAYTIGIEHEGTPDMTWPDAMYESSATLVAGISQRWSIALDRLHVIKHSEIYSKKWYCPGPHCDLDYLIDLAYHVVLSGASTNTVDRAGTVTTSRDLNIRLGAPTSLAPRSRSSRRARACITRAGRAMASPCTAMRTGIVIVTAISSGPAGPLYRCLCDGLRSIPPVFCLTVWTGFVRIIASRE